MLHTINHNSLGGEARCEVSAGTNGRVVAASRKEDSKSGVEMEQILVE